MSITGNFSKERARIEALGVLEIVDDYLKELDRLYPSFNLKFSSAFLGKIKLIIKGILPPFVQQREVDFILQSVTDQIIGIRPNVSGKLRQFWNAHLEMAEISERTGSLYAPVQLINQNREEILKIADKYNVVVSRFSQNTNDEINLFALFYIHILKIDVIEYSFVKQFRDLLGDFNLRTQYDPEEIFSAGTKIRRNRQWRTDGRAIRDSLAHNMYTIEFANNSWVIEFDNRTSGYNFVRRIPKDEFLTLFVDLDFLYRSSLILVFDMVLSTLIKQHFVVESV